MNLLNDLSSLSILNNYCLNYSKIDNKKEIDSIKGTITKLKNDENRLLELLLMNTLDQDMLIKKMTTLSTERKNLETKINNLEKGISLTYKKDIQKLYEQKDINELIGINPIWNLLNRNAKKDLISNMIDYIEISIDEKYNIKIENIVFNNIFLQNKFFNISNYITDKVKETYKNIKFLGIFTIEQFNKINQNFISYTDLMKNYTQDKKSLEIILNKFKDCNIEISLITKNNKYIDTYISFN